MVPRNSTSVPFWGQTTQNLTGFVPETRLQSYKDTHSVGAAAKGRGNDMRRRLVVEVRLSTRFFGGKAGSQAGVKGVGVRVWD